MNNGETANGFIYISGDFLDTMKTSKTGRIVSRVTKDIFVRPEQIKEVCSCGEEEFREFEMDEDHYDPSNELHRKVIDPEGKASYHFLIPHAEIKFDYGGVDSNGKAYCESVRVTGLTAKEWTEIIFNAEIQIAAQREKSIKEINE